jgi:uracil-DNA glycosylase family 4
MGRAIEQDLDCVGCPLRKEAHVEHKVPSYYYGKNYRELFIVAEAPGKNEDQQGEPMVGSAGRILWNLLDRVDLSDVTIGNVIRCRPPDNRVPTPEEIRCCVKHLYRDLRKIKPKMVLLMGKTPAQALLKSKKAIAKLRNQGWYQLRVSEDLSIDTYVTYHPSVIHYDPDKKSVIESDLLRVQRKIDGEDSGKINYDFNYICDLDSMAEAIDDTLQQKKVIGFDWEAMDLRLVNSHPLCFAWGWRVKTKGQISYKVYGVPLRHKKTPFGPADYKPLIEKLKLLASELMERAKNGLIELTAHNGKFDNSLCADVLNITFPQVFCTLQGAHAIDENRLKGGGGGEGIFSLEALAGSWLGVDPGYWDGPTSDLLYSGQGDKCQIKKLTEHCAKDVAVQLAIRYDIERRAQVQNYSFDKIMPLLEATPYLLSHIERNGMPIDQDKLASLRSNKGPLVQRQTDILKELHELSSVQKAIRLLRGGGSTAPLFAPKGGSRKGFHIRKRDYLSTLFFDVLDIPWGTTREQQTKTGLTKIDKDFFDAYKNGITEVALVSEWKALDKLVSTYIEGWWDLVKSSPDGRIRANFNPAGTTTGRLSCFPAGTLVLTRRGFVRIEEIGSRDEVATREGYYPVSKQWCTGEHKVYKLFLSNGVIRRVSGTHLYLTAGGWQSVATLKEETSLYVSQRAHLREGNPLEIIDLYEDSGGQRIDYKQHPVFDESLAEIIGYSVANGHLRPGRQTKRRGQRYDKLIIATSWDDPDLLYYLQTSIENLFDIRVIEGRKTCPTLTINSTKVCMLLKRFGLHRKSIIARTPSLVWQSPSTVTAAYLRGLFEGAGGVGSHVYLTSSSYKLLKQTQLLLTQFGVISSVKSKNDDSGFATSNQRWVLYLLGQRSIHRFNTYIGFISERKKTALTNLLHIPSFKDRHDLFDLPDGQTKNDMYWAFKRTGYDRLEGKCLSHFFTGREKGSQVTWNWLQRLVEYLPYDLKNDPAFELAQMIVDQDLAQLRVEKVICSSETVPMYDLSVEDFPEFLIDGAIVHNCKNPNLQQIPKGKNEAAKTLKSVFRPNCVPGSQDLRVIVSCDLSQAEVRWLAEISGETVLRDMYVKRAEMLDLYSRKPSEALAKRIKDECDLHRSTAAEMEGVAIRDVTDGQRGDAKTITFGNIYGQTEYGLAAQLGCSEEEAKKKLARWMGRFLRARDWFDTTEDHAKKYGWVESPMGRRRHLDALLLGADIREGSAMGHLLRVSRNAPIQSVASDMNVWIAIKIQRYIDLHKKPWLLLALVHDAIIAEIPIDSVLDYVKTVKAIGESPKLLNPFGIKKLWVPHELEFEVGFNYGETKKLTTSVMEQEQVVSTLWKTWKKGSQTKMAT